MRRVGAPPSRRPGPLFTHDTFSQPLPTHPQGDAQEDGQGGAADVLAPDPAGDESSAAGNGAAEGETEGEAEVRRNGTTVAGGNAQAAARARCETVCMRCDGSWKARPQTHWQTQSQEATLLAAAGPEAAPSSSTAPTSSDRPAPQGSGSGSGTAEPAAGGPGSAERSTPPPH